MFLKNNGLVSIVFDAIKPLKNHTLWVAYSGGIDSTVLLFILKKLRDMKKITPFNAIHINHGLSKKADHWQNHCQIICNQWAIPIFCKKVYIDSKHAAEEVARQKRYQVFESFMDVEDACNSCLLQAHHQNDQVETFLFRLFRGSGFSGLMGIPKQRKLSSGLLMRPLLETSKRDICSFASDNKLKFIEDESNKNTDYKRNFLRLNLIPLIELHWPHVDKKIISLINDIQDNESFVTNALVTDIEHMISSAPKHWHTGKVVDLFKLNQCSSFRARQVIRYWLKEHHLMMPDRKKLEILFNEVIFCKKDSRPKWEIQSKIVTKYKNNLVIMPTFSKYNEKKITWNCKEHKKIRIKGVGVLGIDSNSDIVIEVFFRHHCQDLDNFRVLGRSGSKSLKKWLQEFNIPPWLRDKIPLLFYNGKIIAIADIVFTDNADLNSKGKLRGLFWISDLKDIAKN